MQSVTTIQTHHGAPQRTVVPRATLLFCFDRSQRLLRFPTHFAIQPFCLLAAGVSTRKRASIVLMNDAIFVEMSPTMSRRSIKIIEIAELHNHGSESLAITTHVRGSGRLYAPVVPKRKKVDETDLFESTVP